MIGPLPFHLLQYSDCQLPYGKASPSEVKGSFTESPCSGDDKYTSVFNLKKQRYTVDVSYKIWRQQW
jgi:hypothetical protein